MAEQNGLPVSGYKPQSEQKIALVNEFKADEERLLRKVETVMRAKRPSDFGPLESPAYDGRWAALAKTHFEQGFMALNRAVFQPGRVKLPEDTE